VARRLLILTWHNVDRTWCYPCDSGAGALGLEQQLRRLSRFARVVPLRPALNALRDGRRLPLRAVALTFDDGFQDNLELAVPLLESLGLPATFFLVPGMLSGEVHPWWEVIAWAFSQSTQATVSWSGRLLPTRGRSGQRSVQWAIGQLKMLDRAGRDQMVAELVELLAPEGRPNDRSLMLDWNGARELVRRGFSIGSHSMYHAILSREPTDRQARDLAVARQQLETELGIAVELLAYPNGAQGDYDTGTIQAAKRAGYAYGFTVRAGYNVPSTPDYEMRRVVLEPVGAFSEMVVRRIAGKLQGS
jgi:peptidoglycan/xylan/chitin deacetylase (PgdA/CDA1 family)